MDRFGGKYKVFGGQAGSVGTGAAEIGVFDYGGANAEGGGACPAEIFAGFAGADGEGVVVGRGRHCWVGKCRLGV